MVWIRRLEFKGLDGLGSRTSSRGPLDSDALVVNLNATPTLQVGHF